jgi:hypothetical protein
MKDTSLTESFAASPSAQVCLGARYASLAN